MSSMDTLEESCVTPASFGASFNRSGYLPQGHTDEAEMSALPDSFHRNSVALNFPAPQLDTPQRVGPPSGINVPDRVTEPSRDYQIRQSFGLNSSFIQKGEKPKSKYDVRSYGPNNSEDKSNLKKKQHAAALIKQRRKNNNTAQHKLRDYSMLASACKRAGRMKQESDAHYCMGVLYDNIEKWEEAIECYKMYHLLCRKSKDFTGEAIACNACGVDYYNLAVGGANAASLTVGLSDSISAINTKHLNEAIKYYKMHYKLCNGDESGRFVAICNLGLCHTRLEEFEKAAECFQEALNLAISLDSPQAQSLAVGNLGLTASHQADWESARQCMDKHLHLVRDLQNVQAECLACQQLGQIANKMGDYEEATLYYEEARRIARGSGEELKGMLKLVNCNLGVSHGNIRFSQFKRSLSLVKDKK